MRYRNHIFITVLFFSKLILSSQNLYAQDKYKAFYKEPISDISISYLDLMSENIGFSDLTILEKSFRALSDKSYVHDKMIKSLLYASEDTIDTVINTDTTYYEKMTDCPHISAYRAADPLLIVNGIFCFTITHGDSNILLSYLNYLAWQSQNVPHSPLGKNTPPDNYNIIQKQKWLCNYSREWIEQYPDEYHIIHSCFDSIYTSWKIENKLGTYSQFLLQNSRVVQRNYDKGVEILLHAAPDGIKSQKNKVVLPDNNIMHTNPGDFVKDTYETLFQRIPSEDELKFLKQFIRTHKDLTVRQFYYAMMTSDEYKYY